MNEVEQTVVSDFGLNFAAIKSSAKKSLFDSPLKVMGLALCITGVVVALALGGIALHDRYPQVVEIAANTSVLLYFPVVILAVCLIYAISKRQFKKAFERVEMFLSDNQWQPLTDVELPEVIRHAFYRRLLYIPILSSLLPFQLRARMSWGETSEGPVELYYVYARVLSLYNVNVWKTAVVDPLHQPESVVLRYYYVTDEPGMKGLLASFFEKQKKFREDAYAA